MHNTNEVDYNSIRQLILKKIRKSETEISLNSYIVANASSSNPFHAPGSK